MKRIVLMCLILFVANLVFSDRIGSLPGVMKQPGMIQVFGNELIVVEGSTIFIYSLKDMSLKRKFGKKGEGPGELKFVPNWQNRVTVYNDYILAEGVDKLIYFSRDGKLIKERQKTFRMAQVIPIGKNFVGKERTIISAEKVLYITLNLYNPELQKIKELYRQKFPQQGPKINMNGDLISFQVYHNKIFIEESPRGFVIEVFDSEGKKLYQITKKYEKIDVTSHHRKAIINEFKEDPQIKAEIEKMGGWQNFKNQFDFKFSDTFPAIQSIAISNNKLYVKTYKVINDKTGYVIMDLKGKIINKVYIPQFLKLTIMARVLGVKLDYIVDNKLYFIKENEEKEGWELHVEEIK